MVPTSERSIEAPRRTLRHRLLRQTNGFEGLLPVAVDFDPHDRSIAQGQDEPLFKLRRGPAALAQTGPARPLAGRGSVGYHVLNLRVRPLSRAEVTAFPFRVDRAHEVQVLG